MQRQFLKIIPPEGFSDNQDNFELSPEVPYLDFDLEVTEEEKFSLDKLTITSQNNYINYDRLDSLLEEANEFINKIGEGNSEVSLIIAKLIVRIVNQAIDYFLEKYNRETAIVEMRASTPNPLFQIPRWHQDGLYFSLGEKENYKAVVTLKGPSTLFYRPSQEQKEFMEQLKRETPPPPVDSEGKLDLVAAFHQQQKNRVKLADAFDKSKATSPTFGRGSIFIAGTNYAAVHSEPDITSQRFFLSITPGSKEQIKEREENVKKNYSTVIRI